MACDLKQDGFVSRARIGAILLAAGQGSRMGSVPKSLLELEGVPLINRQLIALSGAEVDEVVVVTGYHHERVEPAVAQSPVKIVRNPNPENGQASSVSNSCFESQGKFEFVNHNSTLRNGKRIQKRQDSLPSKRMDASAIIF